MPSYYQVLVPFQPLNQGLYRTLQGAGCFAQDDTPIKPLSAQAAVGLLLSKEYMAISEELSKHFT